MMIKEICLIAMVAFGLTLVIPRTNVEARDSPQQNSLGSHLQGTSLPNHGANAAKILFAASSIIGLGLAAYGVKILKAHKDNPQQTPSVPGIAFYLFL
jgi:hypothetical protein